MTTQRDSEIKQRAKASAGAVRDFLMFANPNRPLEVDELERHEHAEVVLDAMSGREALRLLLDLERGGMVPPRAPAHRSTAPLDRLERDDGQHRQRRG